MSAYEPVSDHVLRVTVGSAFREPTFLESYIDLFVTQIHDANK